MEALEPRQMLTRVVGYFPEYRYSRFADIDLSAVTHINYFSIAANADGSLSTTNANLSHLATIVSAAHAQGKTVSITLDWATPFMTIAANPTALSNFVSNVITFCTTHRLDGIDLDWEPSSPTSADINRYGQLIDALNAQAEPRGLLMSAAVNAITKVVPLSAVSDLDWISVMTYDLKLPNHADYSDAVTWLNGWANYGVPKDKLLMGVPFYGRDQSTNWSTSGTATYHSIVNATQPGFDLDVVHNPSTGKTWHYNGKTTIQRKARYVRDNGFGGMMIWELGQDHFNALGDYTQWSLLPAIKQILMVPMVPEVEVRGNGQTIADADNTPSPLDHTDFGTIGKGAAGIERTFAIVNTGSAPLNVGGISLPLGFTLTASPGNTVLPGASATFKVRLNTATVGTFSGDVQFPTSDADEASFNFRITGTVRHAGDASGDGKTNIADYLRIDRGFARGLKGFENGDFDASGTIDGADYFIIDQAYLAGLPAASSAGGTLFSQEPVTVTRPSDDEIERDTVLEPTVPLLA